MNKETLDNLITALSQQQLPKAPPRLIDDVWQKIAAQSTASITASLTSLLAQPRLALGGLALALIVGFSLGTLEVEASLTKRQVRGSLHLEVFFPVMKAPSLIGRNHE